MVSLQSEILNKYSVALVGQDKLNRLLSQGVPHGAWFSGWLSRNGWSNQLVKCYCDNGWLERLCRGVVYRKGDTMWAYPMLASYLRQDGENLHVAAHSALELHGYMHFVPMGKPRVMVALHEDYEPVWLKMDAYDRSFVPVRMDAFRNTADRLAVGELELQVSSPEQAFAECLLLAPRHYGYMDLFLLMEQLTVLRPDKVTEVLRKVDNQRVRRLYLYMAEKAGHVWLEDVDVEAIGLTTSPLTVVRGGSFVNRYKMTIPTELYEYE